MSPCLYFEKNCVIVTYLHIYFVLLHTFLLQSWRRLSSLQRLIIGIVLLSTVVIALFVLPSLLSSENRPDFDKAKPKKEFTPFDELHQIDDVKKFDNNLEDLKKKASAFLHLKYPITILFPIQILQVDIFSTLKKYFFVIHFCWIKKSDI